MTINEQLAIIQRGTDEILPLDELKTKLQKNKPLRITIFSNFNFIKSSELLNVLKIRDNKDTTFAI